MDILHILLHTMHKITDLLLYTCANWFNGKNWFVGIHTYCCLLLYSYMFKQDNWLVAVYILLHTMLHTTHTMGKTDSNTLHTCCCISQGSLAHNAQFNSWFKHIAAHIAVLVKGTAHNAQCTMHSTATTLKQYSTQCTRYWSGYSNNYWFNY